jgi:hypothetical protein
MAANPTAIVTDLNDVQVDPVDPTKVNVIFTFRLLFVPTPTSPALEEQATLVLPDNFTKNDLRAASQNAMQASVTAKGATLSSNRIFGVNDLV